MFSSLSRYVLVAHVQCSTHAFNHYFRYVLAWTSSINKHIRKFLELSCLDILHLSPSPPPPFEKSNVLSNPTHENGRHWEWLRMWNHQNWPDLRTGNLTALSTRFTWNRKLLKYTAPKFESGAVKDSKDIRGIIKKTINWSFSQLWPWCCRTDCWGSPLGERVICV